MSAWDRWRDKQREEMLSYKPEIPNRIWNAFFEWNKERYRERKPLHDFQHFTGLSDPELLDLYNIGPFMVRWIRRLHRGSDPEWDAWAETLPGAWRAP